MTTPAPTENEELPVSQERLPEFEKLTKEQIRAAAIESDKQALKERPDQAPPNDAEFIGWSLMPRLFDVWDFDESGTIDREELLYGVNEYCKLKKAKFSDDECIALMNDVDVNHDHVLDRREFSIFLAKFSCAVNADLDDVVYFMLEILDAKRFSEIQDRKKASSNYFYLVNILSTAWTTTPKVADHVKVFDTNKEEENLVLEDFNTKRRSNQQEKKDAFNARLASIN